MPVAVKLRDDYSAAELRALARRSKDVNQSRRLLSLAALRDGMDRGEAAKIGGMDRQTLRDWVRRFNVKGPDGLIDDWTSGPTPRLSAEQLDELAKIVERGPDRKVDGVVSESAEFTPKSVDPHAERMTLVYRTRIDIDNPSHELVPGHHAGCRRRRGQRFLCRTCGESSLWRRRCWGLPNQWIQRLAPLEHGRRFRCRRHTV